MAESPNEAVFWLPSQVLTGEEILMDKENLDKNTLDTPFASALGFPTEFPYEFDSFCSNSALESHVETESSDEEDFLAGLTRRLTQNKPEKKSRILAGSPQSTLSGIGSWSNRSNVSSNGSPSGPSRLSSPPTAQFGGRNDTWDLISAAAGQVAMLKMNGEGAKCNNQQGRGFMRPQRGVNLVKNSDTGFCSNQSFTHNLPEMNQFQKQEQAVKPQSSSVWGRQAKVCWAAQPQNQHQQIHISGRSIENGNGRCGRPLGLPQSAWPPLQAHLNQQPHNKNSGTRAVFLGGSEVKREVAGTGVFLPRRFGNSSYSRKKSGCSTVLLPAKVVQALSMSVDDMNCHTQPHPRFNGRFSPDLDALMARRNVVLTQQKQQQHHEGLLNHGIRLPQEWTY